MMGLKRILPLTWDFDFSAARRYCRLCPCLDSDSAEAVKSPISYQFNICPIWQNQAFWLIILMIYDRWVLADSLIKKSCCNSKCPKILQCGLVALLVGHIQREKREFGSHWGWSLRSWSYFAYYIVKANFLRPIRSCWFRAIQVQFIFRNFGRYSMCYSI